MKKKDKNKLENELERFTSNYCWENLQGDETWSNNFHNCTLRGAEIAQKYFNKILLDMLNKHRSDLSHLTKVKLDKVLNLEKIELQKARIDALIELQNKLK